jgi:hypothetical protein
MQEIALEYEMTQKRTAKPVLPDEETAVLNNSNKDLGYLLAALYRLKIIQKQKKKRKTLPCILSLHFYCTYYV